MAPPQPGSVLLRLAAEAILPVASALPAEAGRCIDLLGPPILRRWHEWLNDRPAAERRAALDALAALSPEQARAEAAGALEGLATAERGKAIDYLVAIPALAARAVLPEEVTGPLVSAPPSAGRPSGLLALLPVGPPPYPVPSDLPGTPYRLEELLGRGGFGAVYRAAAASLQHLPLAIKFCLDPAGLAILRRERDVLERLTRAGGAGAWRLIRLYGYDLDHPTPYLVYELAPGGDLLSHLARQRRLAGRSLAPDEVLGVVRPVAEALAFAHGQGLVHRDLKPANVLVDGEGCLKLGDFGLGGVAVHAAETRGPLSAAVSSLRGAGTPLYMAPEQRRGEPPDPRHDLYSLGVMWFQLLLGDLSRELTAGWARELEKAGVPRGQIDLVGLCVGPADERPRDAGALLALLAPGAAQPAPPAPAPAAADRARHAQQVGHRRYLLDEAMPSPLPTRLRWVGLVLSAVGAPAATAGAVLGISALTGNVDYLFQALWRNPAWLLLLGATAVLVPLATFLEWRKRDAQRVQQTRRLADQRGALAGRWPEMVDGLGEALDNALLLEGLERELRVHAAPSTAAGWRRLLAVVVLKQIPVARALAPRPRSLWAVVGWLLFALLPPTAYLLIRLKGIAASWPQLDEGLMAFAFAPPMVAGLVVFFTLMRWWNRVRQRWRLGDPVLRLAEGFPDELLAWGGPEALRDPATLRGLITRLEADTG
jgi:hypothetical protein